MIKIQYKVIRFAFAFAAACLLLFSACSRNGDTATYDSGIDTPSSETVIPASDAAETSEETETLTEEVTTTEENKETDYSVDGWLADHPEADAEEALVALLKARSDLVKEKDLGGWYTLQTTTITVTGNGISLEITDEETIRQIGEFLAPEKLRACVAHPEIIRAVENPVALEEEIQYYSGFSGGDYLLLDLHNGVFVGVLFDPGDAERESTEVRIGSSGQLTESIVEIPASINPEIPFIYSAGNYNTGREIERLLADLIGNLS